MSVRCFQSLRFRIVLLLDLYLSLIVDSRPLDHHAVIVRVDLLLMPMVCSAALMIAVSRSSSCSISRSTASVKAARVSPYLSLPEANCCGARSWTASPCGFSASLMTVVTARCTLLPLATFTSTGLLTSSAAWTNKWSIAPVCGFLLFVHVRCVVLVTHLMFACSARLLAAG